MDLVMERIGFIGLGAMGAGMARNILGKHGQLSVVAHRNREAVEALSADGATECSTPEALASDCDIILLCLPNSQVVEQTIEAMSPALRPGQMIIDTGTSALPSTLQLEKTLSARDVAFVEAPLTGGAAQADAAELGALVGADDAAFARALPVLNMICATVQHFGPVGAGARAKFINNYMVMGIAALVTEAFHAAAITDTDWNKLYDVVIRGSADSGVLRRVIGNARNGDYSGYVFSVENAAKDMGYISQMLDELGRNTPMAQAVKALFDRAVLQGHGPNRISELLRPDVRAELFSEV
jgi:3-hydroxyisobutyrate dehydrogenase-like beta-hydroxyacid dehydrogenase